MFTEFHKCTDVCYRCAITKFTVSRTHNAVMLSWTEPESLGPRICVDAYEVRYSYGLVHNRVIVTSRSYMLSGLNPNTRVKFDVIALCSYGGLGTEPRQLVCSGENDNGVLSTYRREL